MKIINVTIAISLILLIGSCKEPEKTGNNKDYDNYASVKTTYVLSKNVVIPIKSSGTLFSKQEIKLGFKTGGIIKNIYVDEGEYIEKGDVLATLDLLEVSSKLNQAKQALKKVKRDYKRAERLYNDTVISLEKLQNIKTSLDLAKSDFEVAKFNYKYSQIKAPADGRILKKLYDANEIVKPGAPVFRFGCTESDWIVRIKLSDKNILNVSYNDSAQVFFDAYPTQPFKARVSEIGNSANSLSGTFEVELTVVDKNHKLLSGLIAKTTIYPSKTHNVVLVPINSIIEGQGQTAYVYKIKDNKPVKTKIEILEITNNHLYVTNGIKSGEQIIVEGMVNINEDEPVKTVNISECIIK